MDELIARYIQYLQYERNSSPHTVRNYRSDLLQFRDFLTQGRPGEKVSLKSVDALRIRGFLAFLFEKERKKTSIARKLASVRAFFTCMAPCTSMSKSTIFPSRIFRSTNARGVP